MPRKFVSKGIQTKVLLKSKRRCALCFGLYNDTSIKEGQIAHIDRNNQNDAEENLAFLCLNHHNEYDSIKSQSKNLTEQELKIYKSKLEQFIEYSSIPEKMYCDNDYKLYNDLKNNFIDTGLLTRFQNFNFGNFFHLEDFEISEGVHGNDLINGYNWAFPYARFVDPELNFLFNEFKNSFYIAESMLSTLYQNYNSDNIMYYNNAYTIEQKYKHREEFNMWIEKAISAMDSIFILVESTIKSIK